MTKVYGGVVGDLFTLSIDELLRALIDGFKNFESQDSNDHEVCAQLIIVIAEKLRLEIPDNRYATIIKLKKSLGKLAHK